MGQVAQPIEATAEASDQNQFLTFCLRNEVYAVEILSVREIIDFDNITAVPMMPPFIRGVINLRGSVVPVVDLASRFGKDLSQITKRTAIVIIELQNEENLNIGIVVDAVNDVLDIPLTEIEPAPAFGAKIRSDFIKGMGKVDEKFLIILDVGNVLAVDELSLLDDLRGRDEPAAQQEG